VRLVVDTNIVFSTLLNPMSFIGEILLNIQDDFEFFAPELLKEELTRYATKIKSFTRLDERELQLIKVLVLDSLNFVSEDLISES
jgi:predicted nucleic acid-binding protein